jgi:hypothetical protein
MVPARSPSPCASATPSTDFETITISVNDPGTSLVLLNFTNQWKYLDTGADLGTAWSALASMTALGPKVPRCSTTKTATTPVPKNTLLSLTAPGGARILTYYFRTHFFFPAGLPACP